MQYIVVCSFSGALPVVLVLVCLFFSFFLATSKRVRQADMREFVAT